jgi:hypothetical protein
MLPKFFQNTRKPEGFRGRPALSAMSGGHMAHKAMP